MNTKNNVTVLFENGFKITTITHEVEMVAFECKTCGLKGMTEYFCSTDYCSEACEFGDEQLDDDRDDIHSEYLRQEELDITAGLPCSFLKETKTNYLEECMMLKEMIATCDLCGEYKKVCVDELLDWTELTCKTCIEEYNNSFEYEQLDDDRDDIHSEYLRQAELDITAGICRCCKHLDSLNEEGLCFDCYYDQEQELKPVEITEDDLPF